MKNFYAECGEDKWISEHISLPLIGTYVDVGASYPKANSQTAFLRDMGWGGVAIEGNGMIRADWQMEGFSDHFYAAVVSIHPVVRFHLHENSYWSRISGLGKACHTSTLQEILCERGIEKIDFLSIDVEGEEFNVIQTFDIERHQPSIIVAEYDTAEIGKDYRLLEYLLKSGKYAAVHQTASNIIYVRTPCNLI